MKFTVLVLALLIISPTAFAAKQAVNRADLELEASAQETMLDVAIIHVEINPTSEKPSQLAGPFQGYVSLECKNEDGIDAIRVLIQDDGKKNQRPGCNDTAENAFDEVCAGELLGCIDG